MAHEHFSQVEVHISTLLRAMALTAEMAERIIADQRASLLKSREEERCRLADPLQAAPGCAGSNPGRSGFDLILQGLAYIYVIYGLKLKRSHDLRMLVHFKPFFAA